MRTCRRARGARFETWVIGGATRVAELLERGTTVGTRIAAALATVNAMADQLLWERVVGGHFVLAEAQLLAELLLADRGPAAVEPGGHRPRARTPARGPSSRTSAALGC